MDERAADDLAWAAFNLGLRVTLHAAGRTAGTADYHSLLMNLYRIADGAETLHEPADLGHRIQTRELKQFVAGLANASVLSDRDLATRIRRGYERAADDPDARSDSSS